jgi:hypothetical protein
VPAERPGQEHRGAYAWAHTKLTPGAKLFYKVEVVGRDGAFEWSEPLKVHVPLGCDTAPGAPLLRGPADGDAVSPGTITLKWSRELCATEYRVQVRRKSLDGKMWDSQTTTSLKAKFDAPVSKKRVKLYWRVRACHAELGCGPWSEARRINVEP